MVDPLGAKRRLSDVAKRTLRATAIAPWARISKFLTYDVR
jgi:hypothetical protein